MSDYISREELKTEFIKSLSIKDETWLDPNEKHFMKVVDSIPLADVRENTHGTWEHWKGEKFFDVPVCSNCGMTFSINARGWSFCPNCGADMRGENE